ncbi:MULTISPECIES: M20 family metallopeptidase [unclassified Bacillus (in: firmicutes)]|uniref:M20 family metallopeptidase n=1 Tax=unclassified Bacillus (in: firmicutes) TaxID=185979 RepID=UPI0004E0C24D|nr:MULTISPECIES: M20 family metallopeptidase [unclassified Bacillus (in: firmicutes)]REB75721.1 amidohydrolase [Cutibacterium acnes]
MLEEIWEQLENYYDEMVEIRRYLHQHPELSFKEYKTAQYIISFYEKLGIQVTGNIGGNGVVAKITGGKPGKTVALRADFDALPIQDEKEVAYKSKVPGVMHACGHDGHTATLLILAKVIHEFKEKLSGNFVFIHQHAEESNPGGAKAMIEAGCLENVDAIFGTHLWATLPTGTVSYKAGPMMAAADEFKVKIQGQGGHGAQPHKTKDSLVTASQLVINLQQIVSRKVNPIHNAVLTVGYFESGNAFNVIADTATIGGTVRTFNLETQALIKEELERVIKGTCYTANSTYEYEYDDGYPAVVNHSEETSFLARCAENILGVFVQEGEPELTGEDFSYYLQHRKGAFFFTGAMPDANGLTYPHHHPRFDINEKAMLIAAKTLGSVAINYNLTFSEEETNTIKIS